MLQIINLFLLLQILNGCSKDCKCPTIQECIESSQTNTQIVTKLYQDILKREPDESGLKTWVDHMNNGMSKSEVENNLRNSEEYKTKINNLLD